MATIRTTTTLLHFVITPADAHSYRVVIKPLPLAPAHHPETEGAKISVKLHGPRDHADLNGATCQDNRNDEAESFKLGPDANEHARICMQMQERRNGGAGAKLK